MSNFELKLVSLSLYNEVSHVSNKELDEKRHKISDLVNIEYPKDGFKSYDYLKDGYMKKIKQSIMEMNKVSCNILGRQFNEKDYEIDSEIMEAINNEEKRRNE